MSDNDKDATVETDETQEIDMTVSEDADKGSFDKGRQQIQQEIGNKLRPLEERLDAIASKLDSTPAKEETSTLADDDYVTASEAKQLGRTAYDELALKVATLEAGNQSLHHQTKFQSKFPGLDYDETIENATVLAREDNPGVADEHLGAVVASYMNRIGRSKNKTSAPPKETSKTTDKKAPDSAKGASVTKNASVSPGEESQPYKELTADEVNEKYGFNE